MFTWRTVELGEILPLKYGKSLPERDREASGTVDVISSSGITGKHNEALLDEPCVVIGRKGSIGTTFLCPAPVWPIDTTFFVTGSDKIDLRFAYYLLQNLPFQEMNNDSAVPGLNRSQAEAIRVSIPSVSEQREIAETLGFLDDKIGSNRSSQRIIEELIRTYVIRAMDQSVGEVGTLSFYCSLFRSPVAVSDLDPGAAYISFEHMPKGSITLDNWGTQEGLASTKSKFTNGDVLFGKLRPYFKKVGIAPIDGVCSNDILVLRPNSEAARAIVAVVASSDELIERVSSAATGTRMPRTSWRELSEWSVPTLTPTELESLAYLTKPLVSRLIAMTHQNRILTELRDFLLPEILSGRIRVGEVADQLEEVL